MSVFKITWQASDGYAGGDRPHRFDFNSSELNGDESEGELSELFWSAVQHEFNDKVSPTSSMENDFIAWAKKQNTTEGQ